LVLFAAKIFWQKIAMEFDFKKKHLPWRRGPGLPDGLFTNQKSQFG
jgi:hypothetical protein